MAISVAFSAIDYKHKNLISIFTSKFQRLGIPWLFWSIIYILAKCGKALWQRNPQIFEFQPYMLLTGVSVHLWYLPFALVITILIDYASRKEILPVKRGMVFFYILLSILLFVACSFLIRITMGIVPLSQWVFIIPAIPIGMVLASTSMGKRNSFFILLVFFALMAITSYILSIKGYDGLIIPYLVGTAGCIVAWTIRSRNNRSINRLSKLSFGIYLIHPMLLAALHIRYPNLSDIVLVFLLYGSSMAVTWVIHRTPLRIFV